MKAYIEHAVHMGSPMEAICSSIIQVVYHMLGEEKDPIIMFLLTTNLLSSGNAGVLQADPGVIREHNHIFRLFCHECQRVFHDRLIDKTDKKYFYGILSEMSSKHFQKVCSVSGEGDGHNLQY